jgi:hypothetical protein
LEYDAAANTALDTAVVNAPPPVAPHLDGASDIAFYVTSDVEPSTLTSGKYVILARSSRSG